MGLNVTLTLDGEEVYTANYTHNASPMASVAGIYRHVWRPEELDIKQARHLIQPLTYGIHYMVKNKTEIKGYQPANKWGSYSTFLKWLREYLKACKQFPEAKVSV